MVPFDRLVALQATDAQLLTTRRALAVRRTGDCDGQCQLTSSGKPLDALVQYQID